MAKLPARTLAFGLVVIAASSTGVMAQSGTSSPNINWPLILGLVFFLIAIYPLPTWLAFSSRHPNRWIIFGLNLLLGGTGIVWFGCLIWALMKVHDPKNADGNRGGESGLNIFANDVVKVKVEGGPIPSKPHTGRQFRRRTSTPPPLPKGTRSLSPRAEALMRLRNQGVLDDEQFQRMKGALNELTAADLDSPPSDDTDNDVGKLAHVWAEQSRLREEIEGEDDDGDGLLR